VALHWAASAGHVEVVKYLLEQGTEVDARDEVRIVMYTGGYGYVLCTDVSAISLEIPHYPTLSSAYHSAPQMDWTPLIISVSAGMEEVMRLLIGCAADVNATNKTGQSSLHYAASKNRLQVDHGHIT
jgi:26S proteasome non-ATPase regulatory subunit 10